MRNKSMRHSKAISIDCFFSTCFIGLALEIVNILVDFFFSLTSHLFHSLHGHAPCPPPAFCYLDCIKVVVMRADSNPRLNKIWDALYIPLMVLSHIEVALALHNILYFHIFTCNLVCCVVLCCTMIRFYHNFLCIQSRSVQKWMLIQLQRHLRCQISKIRSRNHLVK